MKFDTRGWTAVAAVATAGPPGAASSAAFPGQLPHFHPHLFPYHNIFHTAHTAAISSKIDRHVARGHQRPPRSIVNSLAPTAFAV